MKVAIGITCILLHILGLNAFIIPGELPSILSVVYSNIPTIKKGTDSRIGWGFRLGDRADFQVMVELGPQTNTQPLANQGDNANKRNTINNLANTLYAQRQQEKKNQQEKEKESSNTEAGKWLQNWSKTVSSKEQENETMPLKVSDVALKANEAVTLKPKPGLAIGEIDAKSVIPDDSVLEEMEKAKVSNPKKQVNKTSHKKATDPNRKLISILTEGDRAATEVTSGRNIKPLDDVSLE